MGCGVHLLISEKISSLPLGDEILHSALTITIAENYPGEIFSIWNVDVDGFNVVLSRAGYKRINYADYRLEDDTIHWESKFFKHD